MDKIIVEGIGCYREFSNLEELWASTFYSEEEKKLIGRDRCFWFDDLVVRFPDKRNSSCSVVEVHKKDVLVGCPSYYVTIHCQTRREALKMAEEINRKWLKFSEFSGDVKKFVRELNEIELEL